MHHSELKKNPDYQRRVSWFQNLPGHSGIHLIHIYEYIGEYPGEMPHGQATNYNQHARLLWHRNQPLLMV